MKNIILILGFLTLFAAEILRVYLIMPLPGSQKANTIDIAYWIAQNIVWLRVLAFFMIGYSAIAMLRKSKLWGKIVVFVLLAAYAVVFYLINFTMEADKMFYQPRTKNFAPVSTNSIGLHKLVIGVSINGEAKAYPLQYIGYHHQVTDTVGGTPLMVTYCTVCRTGRVFSTTLNGQPQQFRLVGMDHFNAMFEDQLTKSWWRQVNGKAITGPLKGTSLTEIPAEQVTLEVWQRKHPTTLVMQPDPSFVEVYKRMDSYDKGLSTGDLTRRDSASWQDKSWVVGVSQNGISKAYDWNELVKKQLIEDSITGLPLLVYLENDTASFHVYNRTIDGTILRFEKATNPLYIKDSNTGSLWNADGKCVEGVLLGKQLLPITAYQEFWHSWKTFHPDTKKF